MAHADSAEPRPGPDSRLESWKQIASYLKRDVTTVQRWEKREALPVHRLQHDHQGSVFAFQRELDGWMLRRSDVRQRHTLAGYSPPFLVGLAAAIVVLIAFGAWGWRHTHAANVHRPIVMVMPLKNTSGDAAQEYFAAGVTDALIAAISRIGGIRVMAAGPPLRPGTEEFEGLANDPASVRVLRGSAVRSATRVRAEVTLTELRDGHALWSATYERDAIDLTAIYGDVATAVAREMSAALRAPARASAVRRVVHPDAYDAYLRGLYARDHWMSGGCETAEREFLRAAALDPGFADPYVQLADCYAFPDRLRLPFSLLGPKARTAVERALALDPESAGAHAAAGLLRHRYEYDWAGAEIELKNALALDPNFAHAYDMYGELLYMSGRVDAGLAHFREALSLDPFSPDRNTGFGFALKETRHYDMAIAQFRRTLALQPDYATAQLWLAESYADSGAQRTAVTEYLKWLDAAVKPEHGPEVRCVLEEAYVRGGWEGFWLSELRFAEEERAHPATIWRAPYGRYTGSFYMARRYARLQRWAEALAFLEEGYRDRHHLMVTMGVEPAFDGMRQDPRFHALLRRIGL